jgi:hypothetical protein
VVAVVGTGAGAVVGAGAGAGAGTGVDGVSVGVVLPAPAATVLPPPSSAPALGVSGATQSPTHVWRSSMATPKPSEPSGAGATILPTLQYGSADKVSDGARAGNHVKYIVFVWTICRIRCVVSTDRNDD